MIFHIALLLLFQLMGEALARGFELPLPGPVLGMALFLVLMIARPKTATEVQPTTSGLLSHLSLLFVPAGVGIIGHLDKLGTNGVALFLALLLSTVLAIAAGALTFALLAGEDDADD
ncbi:CidA/LrgA family protein [Litoreibacter roseus]|uniref:CidA/LrgA family protein n=1 Tax=Litoreibacter roseus TaxID=2601869 RepID=A0A6N6JGN8_9RHOB|nr:CidA/LrgA family protein [Litoreibacter roseus]GFE65000.1 CidA/LrgA family protein [Litoreibacter roseus]